MEKADVKIAKLLRLERLQKKIEEDPSFVRPWFFPTIGNVQGFLGTAEVMFVGERPSMGVFDKRCDRLLYSLLEKHEAADAHLTDIIKSRGRGARPIPG